MHSTQNVDQMKQACTSCVLVILHLSSSGKWLTRRRHQPDVSIELVVVRNEQMLDKRCHGLDTKVVRVNRVSDLVDVEGSNYASLHVHCVGGFAKRIVLNG